MIVLSMQYRVYGDPSKVVEEIVSEISGKLDKNLEDAKKSAEQMAIDALNRKVMELRARIDDAVKRYRGSIESSRSKIEVDLKKISEKRKEEWVNRVVQDVKKRFIEDLVGSKDLYRKFLRRSLEEILSVENKITIETNKYTADIIEEIVEEMGVGDRVEITGKDLRIGGGFIALSGDKAVRYNYSLEQIIDSNVYELKVRIAKILFG